MNTIDTNQLLSQLRAATAAAQGTPTAPSGAAPATGGDSFSTLLSESINKVDSMQKSSAALQKSFELGAPNVSLSQVMIAGNKASLAFDAAVQVRNKVVSAYQSVMSMQV